MCKQESPSDEFIKIFTRKELVMMETTIYDFHTSFYIPAIQNWVFYLPHVRILGTNHCGEMKRTAFKRRELFQDSLCSRDYSERSVSRFTNKIQLEYHGENRSVSTEGISLEHFSAFTKVRYQFNYTITPTSCRVSPFLSEDSKHDAATTTANNKRLILLLKDKNVLTTSLSTIWEKTNGCAEQYRCASELYLISVMSQC